MSVAQPCSAPHCPRCSETLTPNEVTIKIHVAFQPRILCWGQIESDLTFYDGNWFCSPFVNNAYFAHYEVLVHDAAFGIRGKVVHNATFGHNATLNLICIFGQTAAFDPSNTAVDKGTPPLPTFPYQGTNSYYVHETT